MSYRLFDAPTMAAISTPWVDPAQDRPILLSILEVAPVVPHLDRVHSGVVALGAERETLTARLKVLAELADQFNGTHDQKYRGLYNVTTAWASMVSDRVLAAKLIDLRDQLCREGLSGTRRSYLAEAGNVEITSQNITEEMRDMLRSITCGSITLSDETDNWIDAGTKLGKTERERTKLTSHEKNETSSAGETAAVRRAWSDVVSTLLANLDLAGDAVDSKTRIRILEPLQNAEKKQAAALKKPSSSDAPPVELDAPLITEESSSDDNSATGTHD